MLHAGAAEAAQIFRAAPLLDVDDIVAMPAGKRVIFLTLHPRLSDDRVPTSISHWRLLFLKEFGNRSRPGIPSGSRSKGEAG